MLCLNWIDAFINVFYFVLNKLIDLLFPHFYYLFQVETWKGKVDKGCIERIKAMGSPPLLVAQVMEMVLVLIGKFNPDEGQINRISMFYSSYLFIVLI